MRMGDKSSYWLDDRSEGVLRAHM